MTKFPSSDIIQQPDLRFSINPTEATIECSFVGAFDKMVEEIATYNHGTVDGYEGEGCKYVNNLLEQFGFSHSDSKAQSNPLSDSRCWYCTSMRLERKNGGLGQLYVTVRGVRTIYSVGIEFETFSRPILGFVFPEEPIDDAVKRVSKIEQWANMKETNHLAEYLRFQYKVSSQSKDSTDESYFLIEESGAKGYGRRIAEKMKRGIDSFDRYLPVITVTVTSMRPPTKAGYSDNWLRVSQVGTQGKLDDIAWGSAIPSAIFEKMVEELQGNFAAHFGQGAKGNELTWVICGDNMTVNEEMVYTRTIQYRGVSEADIDLYPDRAEIQ